METPSEGTGGEFQRPPQGEFRARAAKKSDHTTEKFSAAVARAQLSVLQMRIPNFDRDPEQDHRSCALSGFFGFSIAYSCRHFSANLQSAAICSSP
jgi:hypothetical protein